jgi:hypothetical protein
MREMVLLINSKDYLDQEDPVSCNERINIQYNNVRYFNTG